MARAAGRVMGHIRKRGETAHPHRFGAQADGDEDRCRPGIIADRVSTAHVPSLHPTTVCAEGTALRDLETICEHGQGSGRRMDVRDAQ